MKLIYLFLCLLTLSAYGAGTNFVDSVSATGTFYVNTNAAPFTVNAPIPGRWITALATRTTSVPQRATLELDLGFVDAATGTPVALVTIEQGTQITNVWTVAAPGTIVSTVTNHYSFKLTPSAVVTVTDVSRGTGASVTLSQSQLTSE